MQSTQIIWVTIVSYMLLAVTISFITSLWIRYHLRRPTVFPHCLLTDRPVRSTYCLLTDKPIVRSFCLLSERPDK
ncbi:MULTISPECIES: hypothetical protein [Psychrobacter]|uniref:Uncharacterized protein n=2 Tax=Psychrobacter TaxID=497 RepID=A0A844M0B3_9GAMM|nr:hypothetical protein [Psychrobacter sanguinis]MUG32195.1 hypothetical protein [Psychrobacter sanguinis]